MRSGLAHVRNWIFDLDDTLYPRGSGLMSQIDKRMTDYVSQHLNINHDTARTIQKEFLHQHGTTLSGMIMEYKTDPAHFLEYVHDIDYASLAANTDFAADLARLPGRKFVYTNSSARHAENVIARLGLENIFEGVFDIHASGYVPKPRQDSYRSLLRRFSITPAEALMADDLVRNLIPAAEMGMVTVLVRHDHSDFALESGAGKNYMDYIHHTAHDIHAWLKQAITAESPA